MDINVVDITNSKHMTTISCANRGHNSTHGLKLFNEKAPDCGTTYIWQNACALLCTKNVHDTKICESGDRNLNILECFEKNMSVFICAQQYMHK